MKNTLPLTLLGLILSSIYLISASHSEDKQTVQKKVTQKATIQFNRDVRAILSNHCYACHGPDKNKREAELRLDIREGALKNLDDTFAIVPGKPEQSELVNRINSSDVDEMMPPPKHGKKLNQKQKDILIQWIKQGAKWEDHWAYTPIINSPLPAVKDKTWPINEIDRYLLARLEAEGVKPSPEADRVTLIRRLSFDLIGLPPSPQEVQAFVNDKSANAYEKVVDRLLASKHFGERMAVMWLDLVRYADSCGYHGDAAWSVTPFRDFVINALNRNMPFDQFTIYQIAGDLLKNATLEQKIAAGYNRLNMKSAEGGIQDKEYLAIYAANRVRTTAATWMGATMGCAECHSHKFDPYTTKDFYRFAAFFADIKGKGFYPGSKWGATLIVDPDFDKKQQVINQKLAKLQKVFKKTKLPATKKEIDQLKKKLVQLKASAPTMLATVSVKPRMTRILPRGNWMDDSGEVVLPGVPAHFQQIKKQGRATRLDLAKWLIAKDNPLTSRVFVNRLWKMYFGAGISTSLDDNGGQGKWPSHPQLLDHLAFKFKNGWDIKKTIRYMVMSRAYRQSSALREDLKNKDPYNKLVARQARFRLNAEMIRDNVLTISGLLVRKIGGASIKPYQPKGYWKHLYFPKRTYQPDKGENLYRRSVYIHWQRQFLHPAMKIFDAPAREECTAQRPRSNTPLGALLLLNDPAHVEAARVLATKSIQNAKSNNERLQWIALRVLSRKLSQQENEKLIPYLKGNLTYYSQNQQAAKQIISVGDSPVEKNIKPVELAAWTQVCRALLNLHETRTRY